LKSTGVAVEIYRWAIAQQVEKPSVDFNRFNRTSTEGSFFWRYASQDASEIELYPPHHWRFECNNLRPQLNKYKQYNIYSVNIRCVVHCHALEDLFMMLFLHICHFFTWTVSTCNMLVGRHWSSLCAQLMGRNINMRSWWWVCDERLCECGCMHWWLSSNSNIELNVRGGLGTPWYTASLERAATRPALIFHY